MIKTVAIQGIEGSFHHIVSMDWFGNDVALVKCLSFDKVVQSLMDGTSDVAIMAIENSIAGSILPNYALIDNHQLSIVGEHYLGICHNMMALPGQQIADIREVYSHPMALLQCKEFFKKHPHIKLVEDKDTAEVAQRISSQKLKNTGAVAGDLAAQLFGLEILSKGIQTIQHNETRFVIVSRQPADKDEKNINKASLKFVLEHQKGSLAKVLNAVSDHGLNLTKIQSMPIIETPWKYAFFVDVTFEDYQDYEKAIASVGKMAQDFKILGAYKNAKA